MCDPIYAGVAMLASSGMQAYSQYQSGKFNADVANQNARQNEQAANDSINRGNAEAEKQRSRTRQLAGSQAAAMSANGLDLSSAGALDMFGDTAAMGELDALTLVNNASREAYGLRMQAANDRLQAKMSRREGNFGAATTLLTAPIKAYGAYKLAGGAWDPFSGTSSAAVSSSSSDNLFDIAKKNGTNRFVF
ncbi:hypothetical protein PO864_17745 [Providencia alcalifaciens]|uniref:Uncharacterized protein n=1 Tax=Providencia alcalifaciens 205/92 TaxID=1256988 RepID=A0AAV3M0J7_9GAMM|nr:hypothetical protein [Providencia alcalifaciens]EUD09159.1 hypothetical protein HMPREF1563_3301 [Providencia alcalifaciens 205/92]WGZ54052.1 hypothetical protein PO864_17745 [Providencia alcalifaciens]